jgi:hypothetical protein
MTFPSRPRSAVAGSPVTATLSASFPKEQEMSVNGASGPFVNKLQAGLTRRNVRLKRPPSTISLDDP